jgi:acyl-CoA synthetase (NDP forming)
VPSERSLPSRPDVGRLFDPQSVAIVGIKEKIQYGAVLENMLSFGFDRSRLTLVNPFHPEVRGIPCQPVVPEGTDAAFLLLRAALVPDVVSELIERKVGAAVVVAAGFAERGETGRELQERLVTSSEYIAVCGPNTIGIGNLHSGAVMWGASLPCDLKP